MRLKDDEIRVIKESVVRYFGPSSRPFLFGSRCDDRARGGDIDLLVRTDLQGIDCQDARIRTMGAIQLRLGDQKIDIVCYTGKEKRQSPIVCEAVRTAIPL